jgi:hypothetical protein
MRVGDALAEARSCLEELTLSQLPLRSPMVVGLATPLVEALRLLRELPWRRSRRAKVTRWWASCRRSARSA